MNPPNTILINLYESPIFMFQPCESSSKSIQIPLEKTKLMFKEPGDHHAQAQLPLFGPRLGQFHPPKIVGLYKSNYGASCGDFKGFLNNQQAMNVSEDWVYRFTHRWLLKTMGK
jgi:hypothetical protein